MPAPRSRVRARLVALVSVAMAITGFQVFLAPQAAQAVSTGVVISEVYGAGGNGTNPTYGNDFIELRNDGAAPVDLSGWSVQYRAASGTSVGASNITPLTGTLQPGAHYLVVEAAGAGAGTSTMPTADATGTIAMGGASGQVLLVNSTTASTVGTGDLAGNAALVDMVGYGAAASFETQATTTLLTNVTSAQRVAGADTDHNNNDFSEAVPTPENSAVGGPLAAVDPGNKTFTQNTAITPFNMTASGGTAPYTWSDPTNSLPAGLSVNPAGQVSGTPTGTGVTNVTLRVTDNVSATDDVSFDITVNPAGTLVADNPGNKSGVVGTPITSFTMTSTGGSGTKTWSDPTNSLPAGVSVSAAGLVSGTPTTANAYSVTLRVTDSAAPTPATSDVSFTFTITAAPATKTIAEIQGTGARSSFAPANNATSSTPANGQTVTTQGVITALYTKGFAASGNASCGFCGFYLQTGGSGGAVDATPGASDAIFVYGNPGFTAKDSTGTDLAVGQSVQVTGTISEFASASDPATESTTELTAANASNIVPIGALAPVVKQAVLPATYADREAHEGEIFQPTDLVITDTYNFESFAELGLSSGNDTLQQPNEACVTQLPTTAACIAAAQTDIKNRGWFTEDGTSTGFLNSSTFYRPKNSNNSDVPLPFIDKDHSARVGAHVTFPAGGVLDFRNRKWYVQVPRAVSSTENGPTDLGTDVLNIEDTRPANATPADVLNGTGDLKIATYNVENFFTTTGKAFEQANPYYSSSGPGCEWDYDRNDVEILTFRCTSPQSVPDAWDNVTNAPTHYHAGLVSAPRGAATQVSLDRQTAKIVTAINGLGADVVSLEEIENPNKIRMGVTNGPLNPDVNNTKDQGLGTAIAWRDESIAYLVDHLNAAAGPDTWAFVASPAESTDATSVNHMCATKTAAGNNIMPVATAGTCSWASGQDVIRSGFLYKKATIVPVGQSSLDLPGLNGAPVPSPFDNAREPLAQYFKPVGHPNSDGFAVIVNHFKSKGDADSGDGGGPATGDNANDPLLGAFNGDRTRQAGELLRFANWFADKWDTDRVFLVGDFNAYTGEPPIQTILNDPNNVDNLDFSLLESDDPNDTTYDFTTTVDGIGYGGTGSLDHVFASAGALSMVTGKDTWEINANEPGAYNYSRFNTNKTDFWDPTVPYAGSDHNPFIIGIKAPGAPNQVRDIQIIGTNDFHGRLLGDASDGGAAQLAGAVKSLKNTYGTGNSVFVSGGDNVGASIFESFIADDKPSIDALNAAGLEFSSIGNHEFDKGWQDLTDRIMQPASGANPHGGAAWQYLGANVVHDGGPNDGQTIVAPWAVKDFGDTGVGGDIKVGFIGGVTNDLPGLVSPSALSGVKVNPLVQSVNNAAAALKAATPDVDLIILLVHEGAANTDCGSMLGANNAYADLLNGIDPSIDAVLSGHTHLEYSCSFPVGAWLGDFNHPIKSRPVMQAASYGLALDQLVYEFDTSGKPVEVVQNNVNVKGAVSTLFNYPEDSAVKAIVDQAVADAAGPGAQVLGQITGPFKRARLADGTTENRGAESTLGNQIAEMQRWATSDAQHGSAQIAFMNPGGLRADLNGTGGPGVRDVTYRQAADVQPFANELINKTMTGAQIKAVLEQQWQRDISGNVPSRPFLRLGTSAGFTYTYDETNDPAHPGAKLGHVTAMYLNGVKLDDATSYSVTMNGFLADGGDNFTAFTAGTNEKDTALSDLQAQVAYMSANAQAPNPLDVSFAQHAVQVHFTGAAPATYDPGDAVTFDVSSLAMTGPGDTTDANIKVVLNGNELGTFPVNNTIAANSPYDNTGTASVSVNLPGDQPGGVAKLHLVGTATGTDVIVPVNVSGAVQQSSTTTAPDASVAYGDVASIQVTVTGGGPTPTGTVHLMDGGTEVDSGTLDGTGKVTLHVPAKTFPVGDKSLTAVYDGDASYTGSQDALTLTTTKAASTTSADDLSVAYGGAASIEVTVGGGAAGTPGGTVHLMDGGTEVDSGTLDGTGKVTLHVPAKTFPVGAKSLIAVYDGDATHQGSQDGLTLTTSKAASTTAAADLSVVYGSPASVTVGVAATNVVPTGSVTVKDGGTVLGTAVLSGGVAHVAITAGALGAGAHSLTADYAGDGNVQASTDTFTMTVSKASSTTSASVKPKQVKKGHKVKVKVTVEAANGVPVTGDVTVTLKGKSVTVTLVNGQATVKLKKVKKGGKATVAYLGSSNVEASQTTVKIKLKKSKKKK